MRSISFDQYRTERKNRPLFQPVFFFITSSESAWRMLMFYTPDGRRGKRFSSLQNIVNGLVYCPSWENPKQKNTRKSSMPYEVKRLNKSAPIWSFRVFVKAT